MEAVERRDTEKKKTEIVAESQSREGVIWSIHSEGCMGTGNEIYNQPKVMNLI